MAITGENAFRMRGSNRIAKENLENAVNKAKEIFWNHMDKISWIYDNKALKLEKNIEIAEYNLYCFEYEDNRKRNWK